MRTAKLLTAIDLRSLRENKKRAVGGVRGLTVLRQGGHYRYYLRYTSPTTGKNREYAIGNDIDIKTARTLGAKARLLIENGRDPIEERAAGITAAEAEQAEDSAPTVRECALRWIKEKAEAWAERNPIRPKQTAQRFERHIFPVIGSMKIQDVRAEDAARCLLPIINTHANEAEKVTNLLSTFFRWALNDGLLPSGVSPVSREGRFHDIVANHDDGLLESQNHAALPYEQAPAFYSKLVEAGFVSSALLRFIMLTAARSQAARLCRWKEFDLEAGTWNVPVENDKVKTTGPTKAPNREILLCPECVELLKSLPSYAEGCKPESFVFTNLATDKPFTSVGLLEAIKRLHKARKKEDGVGWIDPDKTRIIGEPARISVHGFRATFRTWAGEDEHGNVSTFNQDAAEFCLLHTVHDKTKRSYLRNTLRNERRTLMNAWGKYLSTGEWPQKR